MRRFELHREQDVSGVSGIGVVAQGAEFDSGACVMQWLTVIRSIAIYNSMVELELIHGHDGKTSVHFLDGVTP